MKYQLYRMLSPPIGVVFRNSSACSIADFWWPGNLKRFKSEGLDWDDTVHMKKSDLKCELNNKLQLYIFMGQFDSIDELKQWLVENYFESFL